MRFRIRDWLLLAACSVAATHLSRCVGAKPSPAQVQLNRPVPTRPAEVAVCERAPSPAVGDAPEVSVLLGGQLCAGLPVTIGLRGGYDHSSEPPKKFEGLGYGAGGDWHQPDGARFKGPERKEVKRGLERDGIGEEIRSSDEELGDSEDGDEDENDDEESVDGLDLLSARGLRGRRPDLAEQFEETVEEAMGGAADTMWGPDDRFRSGNEYTPGDPTDGVRAEVPPPAPRLRAPLVGHGHQRDASTSPHACGLRALRRRGRRGRCVTAAR